MQAEISFAIKPATMLDRLQRFEDALRQCSHYAPLTQNVLMSPESFTIIQTVRRKLFCLTARKAKTTQIAGVIEWLEERMHEHDLLPPDLDNLWMWHFHRELWYRWDPDARAFVFAKP